MTEFELAIATTGFLVSFMTLRFIIDVFVAIGGAIYRFIQDLIDQF